MGEIGDEDRMNASPRGANIKGHASALGEKTKYL